MARRPQLTARQIESINRFPDQNPNPVMRVGLDGTLLYANPASAPILAALGLEQDRPVPTALLQQLDAAASEGRQLDQAAGPWTFALLPVHVAGFDFMNVYGTDVTAARLVAKFPDENPNPVLRMDGEGRLIYANEASRPIVASLGIGIGEAIPTDIVRRLRAACAGGPDEPIEVRHEGRTFLLKPVGVAGYDVTNVYGTDVTATRAVDRFPNQNPHPVLRMRRDGTLTYANPASEAVRRALGVEVGEALPRWFCDRIQRVVDADARETIEVEADGRIYELLVVSVYEFDSINIYGTDVTAAREIARLAADNERLLLNILPASIATRLRAGETVIADRFDEMTVLFADCVGFTAMASRLPPATVVDQLNTVFSAFDALVERHGLEKIKTIGDAYMVAGGLLPGGDHPERVARMGLDMLAEAERLRSDGFPGLALRVGMHVGPAVAGVIGLKKFIYDIWGDTVNVASRMETFGVPGRLQVTGPTRDRLAHAFTFEERGTIDVKSLGPTTTYFLIARRKEPSSGADLP